MGRWLNKLENSPKPIPTELTKASCVSFVSSISENTQKNKAQQINLFDFVLRVCLDLEVTPQLVIDRLLSSEDEQDIINGLISVEMLKLHIRIWREIGMPYYSGKKLG